VSISNDEIDAIALSAQKIAARGAKSVQSGDQKVEFFPPKDLIDAGNTLQANSDPDGCFHSCTFSD
jgi:hypothetical protein